MVATLMKEHRLGKRFEKCLSIGKEGWKSSETFNNILIEASDNLYENVGTQCLGLIAAKSIFN